MIWLLPDALEHRHAGVRRAGSRRRCGDPRSAASRIARVRRASRCGRGLRCNWTRCLRLEPPHEARRCNVGYWGLGLTRRGPARARAGGRDARLRLGVGRRGLRLRRRHRARLAGRADRATIKLGSAIFQMPGALAGDDRDDGGDARPDLGRADAARASARPARRWPRAGTASASARQLAAHARVRGDRAQGARPRAARVRGRDARAAAARRPGQGAEADDRAGAGADPDLPRRDRAEEHAAGGRDRRRLAARPSSRPSTSGDLRDAARGGRRARRAHARRASTSPRT